MKKILILILLISININCQQYEITVGTPIKTDNNFGMGYMAGFSIHHNSMIFGKGAIFGIEYSGFMSDKQNITFPKNNQSVFINECNCVIDEKNFTTNSIYIKQYIRSVSLVFGGETLNNLFMMGAVTNYTTYNIANNKEISKYKITAIGGGLKYLIPIKNNIFSITFRYDTESYIIGVGIIVL